MVKYYDGKVLGKPVKSEAVEKKSSRETVAHNRVKIFQKSEIFAESENFWTYRSLDKSIKSKFRRASWFWHPFGRGSPKTTPNWRKTQFRSEIFNIFFFRHRKTKRPKSSETRYGKVSHQSEPCSRRFQKISPDHPPKWIKSTASYTHRIATIWCVVI